MLGDNGKNYHYYGSDTHRYINGMIKSSKKMYIISPYIDNYYADFVSKRSPSTEFYIISSSMEDDARRTLQRRGSRLVLFLWFALSCIVLYAELMIGIGGYLLLISLLPFLWGINSYISRSVKSRQIHLKVPKQFVHAKMYISDDQAISGSVNLTYKGTHSNVEHIEISKNPDEIENLQQQFWDMWKRY